MWILDPRKRISELRERGHDIKDEKPL
ncbi:hypothetical protein B0181_09220 [Moraxella caviae]|uniref:Uncharacterized protein n=1 Tax=Moraxella caviae TaxID=34060 RepID=A0A1S9ZX74_9GAMM|nr:hypothetical protein B0181_09220 [Moraxella caviae]